MWSIGCFCCRLASATRTYLPTYLPTYHLPTYPLTHLPTYSPNFSTLLPNPTLSLVGTSVRHDLGELVSEQQMGQMDTLHTRLLCLVFLLE